MAPKLVNTNNRIVHVSIWINHFLESRKPTPQRSWMKNSWYGIASMSSKISVLIWFDASCVPWSLLCLSALDALPATLVAWSMPLVSAAIAQLITPVASLVLLCSAFLTYALVSVFHLFKQKMRNKSRSNVLHNQWSIYIYANMTNPLFWKPS